MLTVVTYFWRGKQYHPKHVQQLARSVDRWLDVPHRFVCLSDEPISGSGVETRRNPAPQYLSKCYRRLWLFSEDARTLGERLLHLDLDVVVCGPLEPLVTRPAAFTIYRAWSMKSQPPRPTPNPSVMVLDTGTQTDIWRTFRAHPHEAMRRAAAAGFFGSDQGIIGSLRPQPDLDTFGDAEGVISFRGIRHSAPPKGTRIVSFHGRSTPWDPEIQVAHPWIAQAWQGVAVAC